MTVGREVFAYRSRKMPILGMKFRFYLASISTVKVEKRFLYILSSKWPGF